MKNRKTNKSWITDHINDPWVKLAQKEGYRARSAYKLKEIDEVFHLIAPGQTVVELGSTPGAWSQYLRQKIFDNHKNPHKEGLILALDILPMQPVPDVHFVQGDFLEDATVEFLKEKLAGRAVDVVVSDMAPNLSGHASTDAARVQYLVELAIDFSSTYLKAGGSLVAKVFHGTGYDELVRAFRENFKIVKAFKPKASRDRSAETYLVGLHRL